MQPSDQPDATTTTETTGDITRVAYHTPVFVHHGSAANIVRNLEGNGSDGGGAFPSDTLS